MFFVEVESFGGVDDIVDIALSSFIGVEVEELEENLDVVLGEDGVFGYDVLSEHGFLILLDVLPELRHRHRYIQISYPIKYKILPPYY